MTVTLITKNGFLHFDCLIIDYNSCWIYNGPAYWDDGYPIINRHGKNWIASRFIWYILTSRDYHKREVHHECGIKSCVNPFHLKEITARKHRIIHNRIKMTHQAHNQGKRYLLCKFCKRKRYCKDTRLNKEWFERSCSQGHKWKLEYGTLDKINQITKQVMKDYFKSAFDRPDPFYDYFKK